MVQLTLLLESQLRLVQVLHYQLSCFEVGVQVEVNADAVVLKAHDFTPYHSLDLYH
jgi:hypothetical protein